MQGGGGRRYLSPRIGEAAFLDCMEAVTRTGVGVISRLCARAALDTDMSRPGPIRHGCLIRLATKQTAAFHLMHLHWPRRLVLATPDAGPASGQNKPVCFQPGILIRCLGE
jgi:hypothetical protein